MKIMLLCFDNRGLIRWHLSDLCNTWEHLSCEKGFFTNPTQTSYLFQQRCRTQLVFPDSVRRLILFDTFVLSVDSAVKYPVINENYP